MSGRGISAARRSHTPAGKEGIYGIISLIRSMKCSAISGPVFEQHNREGHLESHDRLVSIIRRLPENLPLIEPVRAACGEIERVHDPGYLAWLRGQCLEHTGYDYVRDTVYSGGYLEQNTFVPGFIDPNTYINPHSYDVATYAAGSAVAAMERALDGTSCFALVRPPGHHAAAAWAMGFCLMNNAAIAAAKALTMVDRVAIIDWDVHHGNGTQDIFYGSDRVLYCSVHQSGLFPHTGAPGESGTGAGKGFSVNAPLLPGSGGADYSCVFSEVFLPLLERTNPDLVIISAGQDTLWDDPVGGMNLVPGDFGHLTALLLDAIPQPLALVLEGGYGPSHGEAVRHIFRALQGSPCRKESGDPSRQTAELVSKLRGLHGL
jgi:acetoin utilization deacetylase AcuC-like enzyme